MDRFDQIVCRGDYENGKPAPDPFLKAAGRLGIEPELCLALEDSHVGVRSASAASMMTVMAPDLPAPTEELRVLCVVVARDLRQVRDLFLVCVYEMGADVSQALARLEHVGSTVTPPPSRRGSDA